MAINPSFLFFPQKSQQPKYLLLIVCIQRMCIWDDGILQALYDQCVLNNHAAIHVPVVWKNLKFSSILSIKTILCLVYKKNDEKNHNFWIVPVFEVVAISRTGSFQIESRKDTPPNSNQIHLHTFSLPFCNNRYLVGTFLIVLEYQHMVIYRLIVHLLQRMTMAFWFWWISNANRCVYCLYKFKHKLV